MPTETKAGEHEQKAFFILSFAAINFIRKQKTVLCSPETTLCKDCFRIKTQGKEEFKFSAILNRPVLSILN